MKVTLEFNLPEQANNLHCAVKGDAIVGSFRSLNEYLRNKIKYGNDYKSVDEALIDIRNQLNEELKVLSINIYE